MFSTKLIREKYTQVPLASRNLTGRTVIVTGANVGLGFETALALLRMKPERLILAVRSQERGDAAAEKLKSLVKGTTTAIQVWILDLGSFENAKAFAAKANRELDRLDILVENAGMVTPEKKMTTDGWETMLQVNVIATAAVALALVGKMQATARLPVPTGGEPFKPHLTVVASDAHAGAKFKEHKESSILEAINKGENFSTRERYPVSKLLDILFARELAKQPSAQGVIVSASNPGFCHSEFRREISAVIFRVMEVVAAKPTELGARNLVWGAVEDFDSGSYIHLCKAQEEALSPFVTSPEGAKAQKKVFDELVTILRAEGFVF
ncbi:NAD(P)-binding protein [Atractiella rhizophila]|nr:NAD(P)-binding protein [Atractiella rhizophila]